MIKLKDIIDFGEFHSFTDVTQSQWTTIVTALKKSSPSKKKIFKIFNFSCKSSKNQKKILEIFCKIKNTRCQYLISYRKFSFYYQSKLRPTFSVTHISTKTLENALQNSLKSWSMKNVLECFFAVCEGMRYLHEHLLCHGNLCPSNIIIDDSFQFYLIDFALYPIKQLYIDSSHIFDENYKDPKISNQEFTFKNDVYSYGVLMSHLLHIFNHQISNNKNEKNESNLKEDNESFQIQNTSIEKHKTFQIQNNETNQKVNNDTIQNENNETNQIQNNVSFKEFMKNQNENKYKSFTSIFSTLIPLCLDLDVSKRPTFNKISEIFESTNEENISKQYKEFIKKNYLIRLSEMNNSYAMNKVGKMYNKGQVFEKDLQKSMVYFKKGSELNNSDSQSSYGDLLQEHGWNNKPDYKLGAKFLRQSAEKGNKHGMNNYGLAFYRGAGVELNISKSKKLLKKSADLDFPAAQINYGYILLNEDNQKPDKIQEGLNYLRKAMDQNDPEAFCSFAYLLLDGKNIKKNLKLAMEYFKIAADMGNEDAVIEFAEGNFYGIGVQKNLKTALKYYRLALVLNYKTKEVQSKIDLILENERKEQNDEKDETQTTNNNIKETSKMRQINEIENKSTNDQNSSLIPNDEPNIFQNSKSNKKDNEIENKSTNDHNSSLILNDEIKIFQNSKSNKKDNEEENKSTNDHNSSLILNDEIKIFQNSKSNKKDNEEKSNLNQNLSLINNDKQDRIQNEPENVHDSQSFSSQNDDLSITLNIDNIHTTDELIKLGDAIIQIDPSGAFKCYKEAAQRGDKNSYIKCARMNLSFETSLKYFELAIQNEIPGSFNEWRRYIMKRVTNSKNDIDECYKLARYFEEHEDFSDASYVYDLIKDNLNFEICYEKAKKNLDKIVDGQQQFYFANFAQKKNENELALILYKKSYENNFSIAQSKINKIEQILQQKHNNNISSDIERMVEDGIDYFEGRNGKIKNLNVALKCFEEASKMGSSRADDFIDNHFNNEYGVVLLKKSADSGDPDCQNRYARYLKDGIGVKKDYLNAMKYFKSAADQGHAEASFEYGKHLINECKSEEDKQKGVLYLKSAAQKLFPDAIFMYSKIIQKINPFDSKKFFHYAIEKGSKLAMQEG